MLISIIGTQRRNVGSDYKINLLTFVAMKYLSFILALIVLLLSTAPCFMEDKCLDLTHQSAASEEQGDEDCGMECCSPFFNCNTCTGFVLTTFHFFVTHSVKEPQTKLGTIPTPPVSDFPFSVWHPPQLA